MGNLRYPIAIDMCGIMGLEAMSRPLMEERVIDRSIGSVMM